MTFTSWEEESRWRKLPKVIPELELHSEGDRRFTVKRAWVEKFGTWLQGRDSMTPRSLSLARARRFEVAFSVGVWG